MKLAVISFTRRGAALCARLVKRFREMGDICDGYVRSRFMDGFQEAPGLCPVKESAGSWTGKRFGQVDGLIYIGAAGIAVRAVAPWLKDKMTDPAVVVVDEGGRFAISLLSGHVGGANALARTVAEILGAEPVITTATDVNGKTAIDVWAAERRLFIADRELAKAVAVSLLEEKPVGFYSDFPLRDELPDGYARGQICEQNVWITAKRRPDRDSMIFCFLTEGAEVLRLVPGVLAVGIGCRKNAPYEQIRTQVEQVLEQSNLDPAAVVQIASIDIKREEAGIRQLADEWKVPFLTFPAERLEQVPGVESESEFVRSVTGTGNVCESTALLAAGPGGRLLVGKQAGNGVTVAVAAAEIQIGAE